MLSFTINNKDLQKLLSKSSNIISRNPKMEIYSLVKITLKNQSLILEVTGMSTYLQALIPANFSGFENVEFLIKPDLLLELLPLIKDEIIHFDLDQEGGILLLKSNKTKQIIRTYNHFASDYTIPEDKTDEVEVDFFVLVKDLLKATKIANTSVGKPKLISDNKFTNICFSFQKDNQLTIASTDKFRISRVNIPINYNKKSENEVSKLYLINPKTLQLIISLIDNQESLNFVLQNSYAWITIGTTKVAIQYNGHEYPDINKIIPQSFSFIYTVETEELKEALKQIAVIARKIEKNKAVLITIDGIGQVMKLESKSLDGSSLETTLPISNYSGGEEIWQQSFNLDYLLEFISQVDEPRLVLEQQTGKVLMSPEDKKDQVIYLASGLKS